MTNEPQSHLKNGPKETVNHKILNSESPVPRPAILHHNRHQMHVVLHKKLHKEIKPVQKVSSVNEASRYSSYNQVQDPMKNHEAYLLTHYARLKKIYKVGGKVDDRLPDAWGRHRSKWGVYQRWAQVNQDRANYKLYEILSQATSFYDHFEQQRTYEIHKAAMDQKIKNATVLQRNRRVRTGARLPRLPPFTHIKHDGLN